MHNVQRQFQLLGYAGRQCSLIPIHLQAETGIREVPGSK